ncbi:unnamed protein product [Schistocephalus solidus]|uniref:Rho-GAP domain-containing protein n=1 Tax=Schistocephalus solidus TaxID=70667 RepID=A0A183SGR2_SCHSO|nr:unnamed protein product [Schistocephalus solidus]
MFLCMVLISLNCNSALLKQKNDVEDTRTFGVPLSCLLNLPSVNIPRIVTNICEFLLKYGLCVEGIFRVNGSAKKICSLKSLFDVSPDFNLTNSYVHDIHAICGVFKLFLREIPDGLVPALPTKSVIKVLMILDTLAEENYILLKYICSFLRKFLAHESVNKMPASNLGIVFGPSLNLSLINLIIYSLVNLWFAHKILTDNEIWRLE